MSPGAPPERLARNKDVIEIKTADHRILSSHCLGEDGRGQEAGGRSS